MANGQAIATEEVPYREAPSVVLDPERIADPSHDLISSGRLEGTPVFNRQEMPWWGGGAF